MLFSSLNPHYEVEIVKMKLRICLRTFTPKSTLDFGEQCGQYIWTVDEKAIFLKT